MLLLRTLVFTAIVPGTVLLLIPFRILHDAAGGWTVELGWFRYLGLVGIVAGGLLYVWCALGFMVEIGGTPAPYDAPRRLVTHRLYARTRNPMYIGTTVTLLGEAVLFESLALLAYAALTWLLWHLLIVLYEEPALRRRFGAAYDAYVSRVPRWLPRLR